MNWARSRGTAERQRRAGARKTGNTKAADVHHNNFATTTKTAAAAAAAPAVTNKNNTARLRYVFVAPLVLGHAEFVYLEPI
jgi:hypothetical protein